MEISRVTSLELRHSLQVPWMVIPRDLSSAGGARREGGIQAVPARARPFCGVVGVFQVEKEREP